MKSANSNDSGRLPFDGVDPSEQMWPEEESLFARDVDGQLIRVDDATADELDKDVRLTIDGCDVTVKEAVPRRDSQGQIIRDADGQPIPRPTTIYDATSEAFVRKPGDAHPIPALCHQEHLPPIGVCRVCVVEATEMTRRGTRTKLVPSCVQRVTDDMIVHTVKSTADPEAAARVRAASQIVVELLMADHLPESQRDAPGGSSSRSSDVATGVPPLQLGYSVPSISTFAVSRTTRMPIWNFSTRCSTVARKLLR